MYMLHVLHVIRMKSTIVQYMTRVSIQCDHMLDTFGRTQLDTTKPLKAHIVNCDNLKFTYACKCTDQVQEI